MRPHSTSRAGEPSTRIVTLLQLNDTHGYLEPHPELFWDVAQPVLKTSGGFARIATAFEAIRKHAAQHSGAVIALDNGDTFHGTFAAVQSRGEAMIEPLNLLRLDAMTAHWDFAYGPRQFNKLLEGLNHPMLAINCYREGTDDLAYAPTRIVDRQGVRVGVVGIAATIVDKTMPKKFSEGLRFTLGRDELPGHIERLRDQESVDIVVVLSHLGFPQDVKLAGEVTGVDAWLSGHTHNRLTEPFFVAKTPIIQSGCHGSFVGKLDLEIDDERNVRVVSHELIHMHDQIAEDPSMKRAVDKSLKAHRDILATRVGVVDEFLHRSTMLDAPMDDLLLRAIAAAAQTKVAFSNGWRYGAPISPGEVTENDLWNIIPPNPPVSTALLTGRDIREMLEENFETAFAPDPYLQMGGYVKRMLGIDVQIKIENPKGARIQQLFVEDAPVGDDQTYHVAFVTTQGVPERFGRDRRHLSIHAIEALRNYLSSSPVSSSIPGRVMVV